MNKLVLLFFLFVMGIAEISCSKSNDEPTDAPKPVVIDDKGKTSDGKTVISIDDNNFYLDYVKYTVEEGHLVVSGYDKTAFKGTAEIVSQITYKGNTYEVLGIGKNAFQDCTELSSVNIAKSVKILVNKLLEIAAV